MGKGLFLKVVPPLSYRPGLTQQSDLALAPVVFHSKNHISVKCYPRIRLIEKWKERNGPLATYHHLAQSLYRADAVDSVHVLCTELGAPLTETDGASLPATSPPPQQHMEHAGVCSPPSLVTCPVGIHNHFVHFQYTRVFSCNSVHCSHHVLVDWFFYPIHNY